MTRRDQLWRVQEAYLMQFYDVPMLSFWGDNHMDIINGRQSSANAFFNVGAGRGGSPPDFVNPPDPAYLHPGRPAQVRGSLTPALPG